MLKKTLRRQRRIRLRCDLLYWNQMIEKVVFKTCFFQFISSLKSFWSKSNGINNHMSFVFFKHLWWKMNLFWGSVDTSVAFLPPHTLIYNPSWKSWKEGEEKWFMIHLRSLKVSILNIWEVEHTVWEHLCLQGFNRCICNLHCCAQNSIHFLCMDRLLKYCTFGFAKAKVAW